MSGYRFQIDACAGPAREGVLDARAQLLVRVRLFDGPGVSMTDTGEPSAQPDAYTDLRPEQARSLAFTLLSAAEHAETLTLETDWFRQR
ncbi:MAG: hypothetical protein ABSB69_12920 [Solirubrobacteraceae bacterium]|jgi:hypothetical protein